jgi:hypothetical protein
MNYYYDKYDVHVRTSKHYGFYTVIVERDDYQVFRFVGEVPDDTYEYFDRVRDNNVLIMGYSGLLDCLFPSVISTAFVEDIDLLPDQDLQELFTKLVRRHRELLDMRLDTPEAIEAFLDDSGQQGNSSALITPAPEKV